MVRGTRQDHKLSPAIKDARLWPAAGPVFARNAGQREAERPFIYKDPPGLGPCAPLAAYLDAVYEFTFRKYNEAA